MHNDSDLIAKHIAAHGVTRVAAHEGTAPNDEPSDYELHIKIKNGRILAAMRRAGIKTIRELAKRVGVNQAVISILINLRRPAFRATRLNARGEVVPHSGEWSNVAVKIAKCLNVPVEALFTERQAHSGAVHNTVVRKIAEAEVDAVMESLTVPTPEEIVAERELKRLIHKTLNTLPQRHAVVLVRRFGLDGSEPETLREVGDGVSPERMRQVEAKALRLMKHPSRSRDLRPFVA